MRTPLQYYLFSKNQLPFYTDANKFVLEANGNWLKPNGLPAHLKFEPDGWQDVLVKYARNIKWWGVFRDFTVPMKFVGDGALIIKYVKRLYGNEYPLYLAIMKLNQTELPYIYRPWYSSQINLTKYRETESNIQVEALEGGLSKYLKAFESTDFEMPMDEVSVRMDGMELENTATFSVTTGFDVDPGSTLGNHLVDAEVVQKEIDLIGGVFSVPRTKVANDNTLIRATGQYIFKATSAATVHVEYNFDLIINFFPPPGLNPAATVSVIIRRIDENNFSDFFLLLFNRTYAQGIPGEYTIQGSGDIPVRQKDELYFYTNVNIQGASGDTQTEFLYGGTEPFMKMSYTYRHPETVVVADTPMSLFSKLTSKMTEGKYTCHSNFLTELGNELVLTSGMGLRNDRDPIFKTSMAKFFKSLNRYCIGLGIENDVLVIERLEYFFKDEIIIDLGEVKDAEIFDAEDLLANTVQAGYGTQEYREINGRSEFNQGQSWKFPVASITKDLDIKSEFRADPFGIELLRINFGNKKTTDNKADNEVFMLAVAKSFDSFSIDGVMFSNTFTRITLPGQAARAIDFPQNTIFKIVGSNLNDGRYRNTNFEVVGSDLDLFPASILTDEGPVSIRVESSMYHLLRPAFSSVVGLLHPASAFNIPLSPKRSMIEWGRYFKSILPLLDNEKITLTSSDKNKDLITVLDGVTISEAEDIEIGNLPEPYFQPTYVTLRADVTENFNDLIKNKPYGKIQFTWNNRQWYFFLMDGGMNPGTLETQTPKLLSAIENDLSKFNESF